MTKNITLLFCSRSCLISVLFSTAVCVSLHLNGVMFMQSVCESTSINCDNLVKTTNLLVSAWIEILAVICKPSPVWERLPSVLIRRWLFGPVLSLWLKLVTNPYFLHMFVLKFRSVCLYRLFLNAVVMQSKLWDQNEDRVWSYTSLVSGVIGRWSINALNSMLTETVIKLCNM